MYIGGKPTPRLGTIARSGPWPRDVFPFGEANTRFCFSGRYALVEALRGCGLQKGERVLMPAYNCGVELDAVLFAGGEPVFYNVTRDLNVDGADFFERAKGGARAALVTHFLGFPQPMGDILDVCRQQGILCIEDCAHALLSTSAGVPLGSFGEVSVFSLLKSLPVPNGGLVVFNQGEMSSHEKHRVPHLTSTAFYMSDLLHERSRGDAKGRWEQVGCTARDTAYAAILGCKWAVAGFRKMFRPEAHYLIRPDGFVFEEALMKWGVSNITLKMVKGTDFSDLKEVRRRNFSLYLEHFGRTRAEMLVVPDLPEGVCPLFFPVFVETGEKRKTMYEAMKQKGVTTHPWWDMFHEAVPWRQYPDAVFLKTRLMGLPVHQDLTPEQVDRVIQEFERTYSPGPQG